MSAIPSTSALAPTSTPQRSPLLDRLDLPEEVTTAEAAVILGCDRKTVLKYINGGLLRWRDIAPPTSSRPEYRLELEAVLTIRRTYRTGSVTQRLLNVRNRRAVTTSFRPKHIVLD